MNQEEAGPLLLSASQAARLCGRSLRTWRVWDAGARVPRPIQIARSRLWRADEIHRWVAAGCPRRDVWEAFTKHRLSP